MDEQERWTPLPAASVLVQDRDALLGASSSNDMTLVEKSLSGTSLLVVDPNATCLKRHGKTASPTRTPPLDPRTPSPEPRTRSPSPDLNCGISGRSNGADALHARSLREAREILQASLQCEDATLNDLSCFSANGSDKAPLVGLRAVSSTVLKDLEDESTHPERNEHDHTPCREADSTLDYSEGTVSVSIGIPSIHVAVVSPSKARPMPLSEDFYDDTCTFSGTQMCKELSPLSVASGFGLEHSRDSLAFSVNTASTAAASLPPSLAASAASVAGPAQSRGRSQDCLSQHPASHRPGKSLSPAGGSASDFGGSLGLAGASFCSRDSLAFTRDSLGATQLTATQSLAETAEFIPEDTTELSDRLVEAALSHDIMEAFSDVLTRVEQPSTSRPLSAGSMELSSEKLEAFTSAVKSSSGLPPELQGDLLQLLQGMPSPKS